MPKLVVILVTCTLGTTKVLATNVFQTNAESSLVLQSKNSRFCKNGKILAAQESQKDLIQQTHNLITLPDWRRFQKGFDSPSEDLEECVESCEYEDHVEDLRGNNYEERREDFVAKKIPSMPMALCRQCLQMVPCVTEKGKEVEKDSSFRSNKDEDSLPSKEESGNDNCKTIKAKLILKF